MLITNLLPMGKFKKRLENLITSNDTVVASSYVDVENRDDLGQVSPYCIIQPVAGSVVDSK
jgi:hypothetical protein